MQNWRLLRKILSVSENEPLKEEIFSYALLANQVRTYLSPPVE